MISKKNYHSLVSKLPQHQLPPDFENNVMETLKLNPVHRTSAKPVYTICCTVLSIFLAIMIFTSPPAKKQTYTYVGENAIFVSNQLYNSVINGCMPQH